MKNLFNTRKKRIIFSIIAGVLVIAIAVGIIVAGRGLSKGRKVKKDTESIQSQEQQTETESEKQVKTSVQVQLNKSNSWEGNGRYYAQYDLVIDNKEQVKISDWTFRINAPEDTSIEQSWNCTTDVSENVWNILPVDYNKVIESQTQMNNVGFIVSSSSKEELVKYSLDFKLDSGAEIVLDSEGSAYKEGEEHSANDNESKTEESTGTTESSQTTEQPQDSRTEDPGQSGGNNSVAGTTTAASGRLHVSGTKLTDSSGNAVQLKGVSTHGISWFPDYVNYDAFATLKNDWGANVVRIAMYPEEYNGYLSGGDKDSLKQIIDNGVNYATQLGMYVIIDWHVLNYAPSKHTQEACDFFAEMASKYAGHDNVIYEICNEPVGADWNSDIKPYAEKVISAIRQYDDHAVILVGTNTWSQDVDSVAGNTLSDTNVMYVAHFYAATHKENIRNKITTALNAGVPVFVSECSICDASGNGGIDYDSANEWLDYMNTNQISFIAWSLSNKAETSALISSGCSAKSGWSDDDLTDTGKWFKSAISGR